MNLLIDIGNTRTKWRCIDGGVRNSAGVFNNNVLTEEALVGLIKKYAVNAIVLSSVGKSEVENKFFVVAGILGIECISIKSAKEMVGLRFAYTDVEALGVDRCLAMIGAYNNKGVLVIDAGSAITADYLSACGEHLGGYILPGFNMLMLSLKAGTSKVLVDAELASSDPGNSTKMCVNNGFTLLIQSLLDGLVVKAKELGINEVVITGGDADLFAHANPHVECTAISNLVLDGMEKLLNNNNLLG